MTDMPWVEAIVKVLQDAGKPMHYDEISRAIVGSGNRANVGATPANRVAANLSTSLRSRKRSPFIKLDRGMYTLRDTSQKFPETVDAANQAEQDSEKMGLINAFGILWDRSRVDWERRPTRLLGVQHVGSKPVDFAEQAGVYGLYDIHRAIYVGRVTEQRLGQRLFEHTRGRLSSRWSRFSWFGVRRAQDNAQLAATPSVGISVNTLIATMEALLIEGLEPPQNRRQGDGFNAVEFVQVHDSIG